ncbi:amidase [Kaistia dalseonensis]|uniref:Amidase n=1 Tax=Kaistia dalseonensis TaxID=410840 RepID=A0ABU0H5P9_9HYPH|nr:amidase [Kaistia dalseonensis]MCX5494202.1 amidase [Kaistia dalseonensis]MDQ0436781.1 amidase [Kaistia dalseonensis]
MTTSAPTASDMVEDLAAGRVSAVDLFEDAVARIEAEDGAINAVVVRDFDRARDAAKAADAALARGERRPFLGVPVTIKESFDIAGLPTSWGLSYYRNAIATADSAAVARLRAAGAVILGKSNVSEALSGWDGDNPVYGRTSNPLDLNRTPGGSSAGAAAAVAAGFVPFDIGSDIGGSIRVPAHFCGLYGHNTSYGVIPLRGHVLEGRRARIDFSCPGPIARSVADLERGLAVMAGPDEDEAVGYSLTLPPARHRALRDYRVLVLTQHPLIPTDPEISGAVERLAGALGQAGARVTAAEPIIPDLAMLTRNYIELLSAALTVADTDEGAAQRAEALAALSPDDQSFRALRLRGAGTAHYEWLRANEVRAKLRHAWRQVFMDYDVLICPPFPTTAPTHAESAEPTITVDGRMIDRSDQIAWCAPATGSGLPATVAPIARSRAGLPIGVQIIAPYLEDYTGLRFAALIRELTG